MSLFSYMSVVAFSDVNEEGAFLGGGKAKKNVLQFEHASSPSRVGFGTSMSTAFLSSRR